MALKLQEAVKLGLFAKKYKIPKTVKAVLLPPPGSAPTMAGSVSGMSS